MAYNDTVRKEVGDWVRARPVVVALALALLASAWFFRYSPIAQWRGGALVLDRWSGNFVLLQGSTRTLVTPENE